LRYFIAIEGVKKRKQESRAKRRAEMREEQR
jgi:hypothetical protein